MVTKDSVAPEPERASAQSALLATGGANAALSMAGDPPRESHSSIAAQPKVGQSSFGLMIGVVLGLGAAGLGYGAALYYPLGTTTAAQTDQVAALQAQLDALKAQVAVGLDVSGLETRLAALETAPPSDTVALETRLAALESKIARQALGGDDLRAELDAIAAKLAQNDPTPAIKAAIAAEIGTVQQSAADMVKQVQTAADDAARLSAQTLLRAALDTGAPYATAAEVLDLPDVLAQNSAAGIPSLTQLKETFPDAARAGLEAALRADMGQTWGQRVTNFLRSQTGARSLSPQTGNDPDAILSRIEAGLRAGDMAVVMAETTTLPSAAQTAMADWIHAAQTRADALAAFEALIEKEK